MAYDDRALRGVGGWLAFFILALAVFSPLSAVAQTMGSLYGDPSVAAFFGQQWWLVQAIELSIMAASVAALLYLGWRMSYVHVWRSVEITIIGLWVIPTAGTILDAVAVGLITGLDIFPLISASGVDAVRSLISAAVWTAYLLRSQRVANTYTREDEDAYDMALD